MVVVLNWACRRVSRLAAQQSRQVVLCAALYRIYSDAVCTDSNPMSRPAFSLEVSN